MASMAEANFLGFEERYDDALNTLDRINLDQLDAKLKPYLLNNRAWYMAQRGQADEAVEVAKAAVELAESSKSRIAPSCSGTLGTALYVANRPAEALPLLLKAFEGHSGQPRLRATNAYYLGLTYVAMNQLSTARSWYERAVSEAPKSRYGVLAAAALRNLGAEN